VESGSRPAARSLIDVIQSVKNGLPFSALTALSERSGTAVTELATQLGISARTLARRKTSGTLSPEESERVLRLANLFEKAVALFDGDTAEAQQWMRLSKKALHGESPTEFARTELGAREVENLLGRLEHGVFS